MLHDLKENKQKTNKTCKIKYSRRGKKRRKKEKTEEEVQKGYRNQTVSINAFNNLAIEG